MNRQSLRKAKRDARAVRVKAMVEKGGGPVKIAELRAAASTRRSVRIAQQSCFPCPLTVWSFRGSEWLLSGCTIAFRFHPSRIDGLDRNDYLPVTPGAAKWVEKVLQAEDDEKGAST